VLADISRDVGLEPVELLASAGSEELRTALRRNTDELIARGGFGSPTIFVGGTDMYFGNDRIPLVRRAVAARSGTRTRPD
jgi:2-hydroxychromene-2-carboxylate isomerase